MNILFLLSGSIAAFKACAVISRLAQEGHAVQCVATENALRFVGPATLEGLSGRPLLTDTFAPGHWMEHIELSRWADVTLLCPATANRLNALAAGLAHDLIGNLWLAHDFSKPFFVAPAMNTAMWRHPSTQRSLDALTAMGVRIIAPESGNLACGDVGEGRLADPETIAAALAPAGPRVLVTAGGTRVPIDAVRFLGNASTGRTGALLSAAFARAGWQATLLRAQSAVPAPPGVASEMFVTVDDLAAALKRRLSQHDYALVVHAAAVSDFTLEALPGKLASDSDVTLSLRPGPKLLPQLKAWSRNPDIRVVGFKLTSGEDPGAAVGKLFARGGVDAVVHNDTAGINRAAGVHRATLYRPDGPLVTVENADALALALVEFGRS